MLAQQFYTLKNDRTDQYWYIMHTVGCWWIGSLVSPYVHWPSARSQDWPQISSSSDSDQLGLSEVLHKENSGPFLC